MKVRRCGCVEGNVIDDTFEGEYKSLDDAICQLEGLEVGDDSIQHYDGVTVVWFGSDFVNYEVIDSTNLREDAVETCARLVVQSNKECWDSIREDEGDEYAGPFDSFGVDSETIRTILKDIFVEVGKRVAELQSR